MAASPTVVERLATTMGVRQQAVVSPSPIAGSPPPLVAAAAGGAAAEAASSAATSVRPEKNKQVTLADFAGSDSDEDADRG